MHDFRDRLREVFERVIFHTGEMARVKIIPIEGRWPFPIDVGRARTSLNADHIFGEEYKDKAFFAVEVTYSDEYIAQHDTQDFAGHPISAACRMTFIVLGLGAVVLGTAECSYDELRFAVPATPEVYARLPLQGELKVS